MNVWTIILAAGEGSRFGGPKALAQWNSGTLLSRAIEVAVSSDKVIVVTGAHENLIKQHLNGAMQVHNTYWAKGMGTSISTGLGYVSSQDADIALIVPVDQPFIGRDHLKKIAAQARKENRCILTLDGAIAGPPAAIPRISFSELKTMKKAGLKSFLADFGLCEGAGMLWDIDTPQDLERLQERAKRPE